MNKLLWQLFEMLREVLPVTEANTKRLAEWATEFRALEALPAKPAEETEPLPFDPDQEEELEELEEAPSRGKPPKRKHR
jgi:hypothetical protein